MDNSRLAQNSNDLALLEQKLSELVASLAYTSTSCATPPNSAPPEPKRKQKQACWHVFLYLSLAFPNSELFSSSQCLDLSAGFYMQVMAMSRSYPNAANHSISTSHQIIMLTSKFLLAISCKAHLIT